MKCLQVSVKSILLTTLSIAIATAYTSRIIQHRSELSNLTNRLQSLGARVEWISDARFWEDTSCKPYNYFPMETVASKSLFSGNQTSLHVFFNSQKINQEICTALRSTCISGVSFYDCELRRDIHLPQTLRYCVIDDPDGIDVSNTLSALSHSSIEYLDVNTENVTEDQISSLRKLREIRILQVIGNSEDLVEIHKPVKFGVLTNMFRFEKALVSLSVRDYLKNLAAEKSTSGSEK